MISPLRYLHKIKFLCNTIICRLVFFRSWEFNESITLVISIGKQFMIIRKDKELFIMKFMENNAASRSYMIFQNNFISLPFISIKKIGNQNSKKFLSQIFFLSRNCRNLFLSLQKLLSHCHFKEISIFVYIYTCVNA